MEAEQGGHFRLGCHVLQADGALRRLAFVLAAGQKRNLLGREALFVLLSVSESERPIIEGDYIGSELEQPSGWAGLLISIEVKQSSLSIPSIPQLRSIEPVRRVAEGPVTSHPADASCIVVGLLGKDEIAGWSIYRWAVPIIRGVDILRLVAHALKHAEGVAGRIGPGIAATTRHEPRIAPAVPSPPHPAANLLTGPVLPTLVLAPPVLPGPHPAPQSPAACLYVVTRPVAVHALDNPLPFNSPHLVRTPIDPHFDMPPLHHHTIAIPIDIESNVAIDDSQSIAIAHDIDNGCALLESEGVAVAHQVEVA